LETRAGVFYTTAELARIFGKAEDVIRRMCRDGEIPGAFKIGSEWRLTPQALGEYIAERELEGGRT
jgi:excisionase family DNA binding protein